MAGWKSGRRVIVLGAGATRGASFVGEGREKACVPPLNADFFTQLQRVTAKNRQSDIDAVMSDVVRSFGPDFSLTLEEYFTHIEALIRGAGILLSKSNRTYSPATLKRWRSNLMDGLSAVLEESADVTKGKSPAAKNPCKYHKALVEAIEPPDTIVSFNYDCVIDNALKNDGRGVWSARYGYCFTNPSRLEQGSVDYWNGPDDSLGQNDTIRLLKLHGSVNWREYPGNNTDPIRLRQKTYKQNGQKNFNIIPPEFVKEIDREPYRTVWKRAASAIKGAESLALIGFSFPPTDQLVEAVFRMALAENRSLKKLIIVNPSQPDRRRIRTVCNTVLNPRSSGQTTVRIIQFDSFSAFAPFAGTLL